MTNAIASISALSVPGRSGIQSSASACAVMLSRGSMTTIRAPARRASFSRYAVLVPNTVSAGL